MRVLLSAAVVAMVLGSAGCSRAQTPAPSAVTFLSQNALAPGVKTLPSGVQYKVVKSGPPTGPMPKPTDLVKVNYEGSLLTGEVFDSSYKTGKPVTFRLENLIKGWIEALQFMRPGDEWVIYVPPSLGYGAQQSGPIPPNSVLVFKLELLAVGDAAGPESQ